MPIIAILQALQLAIAFYLLPTTLVLPLTLMNERQLTINNQPPRLLINLSMLVSEPTGITNYIEKILPHLAKLNPTLLGAKEYLKNQNNLYPISAKLNPDYGTKGHFFRLMWTQFQIPYIYRKLKANLLFSPVPEAPLYSKSRSVVMVHDLIPIRFPKRKSPLTPYFRYYIPQVCSQAEHIICNSHSTAQDIVDYFGIPAAKITPIHLACDHHKFYPLQNQKNDYRPPYFLYLGRHDPHKNVPRLIDAFARIPECKNYQLWLAGPQDPRYTPNLQQQAAELGIKEQVKFLNYVSAEELPVMMREAIALVFTTLWEGFGFPVLEAMACGTPVITSNTSSLPEVAGDAAILVNPHSSQEISDAMEQIATDAKMRSQLRELSIKRAGQFSWQKTGKATVEVISQYI
jgi:glycosyltransferase involved in cell wall biosynthesis